LTPCHPKSGLRYYTKSESNRPGDVRRRGLPLPQLGLGLGLRLRLRPVLRVRLGLGLGRHRSTWILPASSPVLIPNSDRTFLWIKTKVSFRPSRHTSSLKQAHTVRELLGESPLSAQDPVQREILMRLSPASLQLPVMRYSCSTRVV
jgi:hypothetical protein